MFCLNCGTQLPDDANFCLKCGKPQRANIRTEEPRWETCEIIWQVEFPWNLTPFSRGHFWAKAIGPNGVYAAATTSDFYLYSVPNPASKRESAEYDALVLRLVSDGWESTTEKGEDWWSNKFRRRVK